MGGVLCLRVGSFLKLLHPRRSSFPRSLTHTLTQNQLVSCCCWRAETFLFSLAKTLPDCPSTFCKSLVWCICRYYLCVCVKKYWQDQNCSWRSLKVTTCSPTRERCFEVGPKGRKLFLDILFLYRGTSGFGKRRKIALVGMCVCVGSGLKCIIFC